MFTEIVMIDYRRPLAERAKARKTCGPYRWTPAKAGAGRGFYQASKGLKMDRHGSSFALRLELANEFLSASRLARIDGYYADDCQDTTLTPIIARLPHGAGFLAGWTMGNGMLATLDATVHDTAKDAARAAHGEAEYAAERERDYQAQQDMEGEGN